MPTSTSSALVLPDRAARSETTGDMEQAKGRPELASLVSSVSSVVQHTAAGDLERPTHLERHAIHVRTDRK